MVFLWVSAPSIDGVLKSFRFYLLLFIGIKFDLSFYEETEGV